jgi:hypothetical protein
MMQLKGKADYRLLRFSAGSPTCEIEYPVRNRTLKVLSNDS